MLGRKAKAIYTQSTYRLGQQGGEILAVHQQGAHGHASLAFPPCHKRRSAISDGVGSLALGSQSVHTGRVIVFAERCRALGLILCFSVRRRAGRRLGVVRPLEVVQVSLDSPGYVLRVCDYGSGIRGADGCDCRMKREDESEREEVADRVERPDAR